MLSTVGVQIEKQKMLVFTTDDDATSDESLEKRKKKNRENELDEAKRHCASQRGIAPTL